jgi:integrase
MRLSAAIDSYLADMRAQGRVNSPATERDYRYCLDRHAEDVDNRDPRYTNRNDVKRTLRRWSHPNSQRKYRSVLVSFYEWLVEEGERPHNPARQTRRSRRVPPNVYRLSEAEVALLLAAVRGTDERRAIFLGLCAGVRNKELRGLQGRHFQRTGWVWVSQDIAKGGRPRWVPVIDTLVPIVDEIRASLEPDDFVLPAQRWRDPGRNREKVDKRKHPRSSNALRQLVRRVGKRAGIAAPIHPHLLRHAFADHIARHAGLRAAQALLGHAGLATTEAYLGQPTLDELQASVVGAGFELLSEHTFYPRASGGANPVEAPTGIEPVSTALQAAA